MTEQEKKVVLLLADAWNAFIELPVEHPDDQNDFRGAIHHAQNIVFSRQARRDNDLCR